MKVRTSVGLVSLVLATSACSADDTATPEPIQAPVGTVSEPARPVTPAEWKAVIEDWYVDGIFNSPHRCEAVRAAIERLPSSPPDYSSVYEDMRSFERRICD